MKTHLTCDELGKTLDVLLQQPAAAIAAPAFFVHLHACPHCRARVDAELAPVLPPVAEAGADSEDEDHALQDLAAFIDSEQSMGLRAALRDYPHVWKWLLEDADLAETYYLTCLLLHAEQTGDLPPLDQIAAASRKEPPAA